MRRSATGPTVALGVLLLAHAAGAGTIQGSALAPPLIRVEAPAPGAEFRAGFATARPAPDLLAQRAITREWGASEDTNYVVIDVPGYKSEGWALAFSAAAPGAGQLYVGEATGWLFLAAEVAGWVSRHAFQDRAYDRHRVAVAYAGSPYDPNSHWSFARYAAATQQDTLALQQLFAVDPDAFYHQVGFNERYSAGWSTSGDTRVIYQGLENEYQKHLQRSRYATGALYLNHVLAALDAFRAARFNNIPLQRDLRIKLRGSLGAKGEAMTVMLERSF